MARKAPVVIVAAAVVACLVGLRGAAEGQGTLETVIPEFGVTCTSAGQLCEPPFTVPVQTASLLRAQYLVPATHCSSIRLHVFVDGVLVHTTGFLGWQALDSLDLPLGTELLELGPVPAGTHTLALQAEGQVSGCNTGTLDAWGGSLRLVTSPIFGVVAASGMPVPGGTGVFTAFPQSPAVSVGRVAFLGAGASQQGVYLTEITDVSIPSPPPIKVADLATASSPARWGKATSSRPRRVPGGWRSGSATARSISACRPITAGAARCTWPSASGAWTSAHGRGA
jgi:hypothetical protein